MLVVDTHVHISPVWFEPVESLLYHMDQNDVAQAVLLQIYGQYNNEYLFSCARRFPDRFPAVVVNVDTDRPDAVQTLERLAERGASGLRLRPTTRSPGEDPLAIWRAAERLGLSVSVGGMRADFLADGFAALAQSVPQLPIVLEHLGASGGGRDPADPALHQRVCDLARFPNLYIRIHGLGEFCRRLIPVVEPFPFEQPIPPFLDMAYGAFGASRMMWGSDYAPVSHREGYRNSLRLTMDQFATRSEEDRELIFGRVALSVFRPRTPA
jgi:L-fuconolactonase